MYISQVPKSHIHLVWTTVAPMIEKALAISPGRFKSGDIYDFLSEGRQTLWISFTENKDILSAFTTRVYEVPENRICAIEWVGGSELSGWGDEAVETLEKYAKDMNCGIIEGHGRLGWTKLMNKHGWHRSSVSFQKELK